MENDVNNSEIFDENAREMNAENADAEAKNFAKKAAEKLSRKPKTDEKNAELLADLQRTRAEFENYRKLTDERVAASAKTGEEKFAKKVLPLLDLVDAVFANSAENGADEKGLELSRKSFAKTLSELKLEKTDVKIGDEFDHETMFAVSADESDGDTEIVEEVLQNGYFYEGKLVRPAMVKISRK